ncbi:MAG: hypothetical protein U1E76_20200 [Planctomycetota bacterium]
MSSTNRALFIALFSAVFLAHFLLILVPRAPLEEDAFITCRFAENLAAGKGFVFNEGERVEGFSNPSLVMALALAARLGLPTPQTTQVIGLASVVVLIVCFTCRRRAPLAEADRWARLAAVPLCVTSFPFVFWAHQGLETSLYALLLTAGTLCLLEPRPRSHWWGGLWLAVAVWTRPEAPLLAAAALLALALTAGPRPALRGAVPLLLATVGLELWRIAYFGDPLPNTYYAKPPRGIGRSFNFLFDFFRLTHGWYLIPVLVMAFLASVRDRSSRLLVPVAVVAAQLCFIVYEGGDKKPNHRFMVPVLPLLSYLTAYVLASLATRRGETVRKAVVIAGVALLVGVNLMCRVLPPGGGGETYAALRVAAQSFGPRTWQAQLEQRLATFERGYVPANPHTEIGLWVKRTIEPGTTIAYDQMGQTPYFSGHEYRYIDLFGLTDYTVAHLKKQYGTEIVPELIDYLERRAPEFILTHLDMKIPLVAHPCAGRGCRFCAFLATYEDFGPITDRAGNRLGSALRRKPPR